MAKYRVYLVTTASCVVEVEAENGDEAVEAAFNTELPHVSAFAGYDLGEWTTASDLFHGTSDPADDYELIGGNDD